MDQRNDKKRRVSLPWRPSRKCIRNAVPEIGNAHHVNIARTRNRVLTIATRFSRELGIPTRVLFEPDGSLCFPISGSPFWHAPASGDKRVFWPRSIWEPFNEPRTTRFLPAARHYLHSSVPPRGVEIALIMRLRTRHEHLGSPLNVCACFYDAEAAKLFGLSGCLHATSPHRSQIALEYITSPN